MPSTMFKVVLGAMAAQTSAQEMVLGQPAHVQMSSMSAMGPDGIMHTSVHKVITQTSEDGIQKRVSEVDCKDGACSQTVSQFFAPGDGSDSSGFFAQRLRGAFPMPLQPLHERMPMVMGCMHRMHDRMHHLMIRLHHSMPQMAPSGHFLAPSRLVIISDAPPAAEAAPLQVSPDFNQRVQQMDHFWLVSFLVVVPALLMVTLILKKIYRCCFGKASARERPLQELGLPLAPEEQAELGAGPGAHQSRAQMVYAAPPKEATGSPTESYLFNLYQRAAENNEKKVAQAVLRDVYAKALQRVEAC